MKKNNKHIERPEKKKTCSKRKIKSCFYVDILSQYIIFLTKTKAFKVISTIIKYKER